MSDPKPAEPVASTTSSTPEAPKVEAPKVNPRDVKPPKPPNPIWKAMGLPNMKMKLPSRNWMIFIGITGTFSGLVMYDKRETRRAQRKWAKLVEHLAKEPLDPKAMPRKLTVFIESPPIDGLRIAQDHFKDYVKPVLVASGLDWEFIQGRKEGDVRAELAEKIRKERLLAAHEIEEDDVVLIARSTNGTKPYEGPQGEIVIGRNTWKEYVRGLHEGWLGPVHEPKWPEPEPVAEEKKEEIETLPGITVHSSTEEAPVPPPNPDLKEDGKPAKPKQPRPWISTADYANAELPATLPDEFSPSAPIPFPHILGFFNTHIRFYRFLTRRHLADNIGREVAAVILAHSRPYHTTSAIPGESFAPSADGTDGVVNDEADKAEQDLALKQEEKEWHKTTFKPLEDLTKERTWLDDMVLDPRIAGRMRRAELTPEEEARAAEIGANIPEEDLEGWFRSYCRQGIRYVNKEFLGPKQKRPGDVPLDSEDL